MNKQYFVDFDGTITEIDTCDAMAEAFCRDGWHEINKRWEQKKIGTKECSKQLFELYDANEQEVYKFLDTITIDETFLSFVEFCGKKEYGLYILSDGFDLVIRYYMIKYGFSGIPFYANKLIINGRKFIAEYPYFNSDCGECGTCKRDILRSLKKENCESVYIGDGYSDLCVCREAGTVFAKGKLLEYCRGNGISVVPFKTFSDVISLSQ